MNANPPDGRFPDAPAEGPEARLRTLRRQMRILKSCNRILIRAGSERDLLDNICRSLVDLGGYRLVWVGYASSGSGEDLQPAARSGFDAGYVELTHRCRQLSGAADHPACWALRSRTPQIHHRLDQDGTRADWRAEARRRGYASVAAIPLLVQGQCLGVIEAYSALESAFDAAEVSLLAELAGDLAYGIVALRTRIELARRQREIEHLTRVLKMQSAVNAAVLRIRDRDELLEEACRIATEVGRYDRAVVSIVEDGGRLARPRFHAGAKNTGFPREIEVHDGSGEDRSLTGRALRTGEIALCGDLALSEPPVYGRDQLLAEGVRSLVALPLSVDGVRVGALTLSSTQASPLRDDELLLLQDVAATLSFALRSQQATDMVEYLACYDSLTGLATRALFCRRLDALLMRRLGPQENPSIAVFDINHLNSINDSFGRGFGDRLLQTVAERLKRHAGDDERTGYLGGGMFVVVEPGLAASEESVVS
ncbi:MAG: GAF domain-containing protein, partial [Steroidobacteraceae bacterium]